MLRWVEIRADALRHNLAEFRRRLGPKVLLAPVVKSEAYGHGLREVSAIAADAGADWLCVNTVEEGERLRAEGLTLPVLILGPLDPADADRVVASALRPTVYEPGVLDALAGAAARAGVRLPVHLKLETGTHRQGLAAGDLDGFLDALLSRGSLVLEGVSTHYADIEDTTDHRFAEAQLEAFEQLEARITARLGRRPVRHTACSAAAILFTRTHMDLARLGIALYGIWPSRETYVSCLERGKPALDLRPVMTWKCRIVQVKSVAEGSFVGYGRTFRTTRDSRIAVLPVGYHEGYDRGLSNTAHVLVRGRRAPVRGRVCMNMCMVDVTDVPGAEVGDEVVLLGAQGDEAVPAEQVAAWCGTIAYEVVSRILPSLPRIVV